MQDPNDKHSYQKLVVFRVGSGAKGRKYAVWNTEAVLVNYLPIISKECPFFGLIHLYDSPRDKSSMLRAND